MRAKTMQLLSNENTAREWEEIWREEMVGRVSELANCSPFDAFEEFGKLLFKAAIENDLDAVKSALPKASAFWESRSWFPVVEDIRNRMLTAIAASN